MRKIHLHIISKYLYIMSMNIIFKINYMLIVKYIYE